METGFRIYINIKYQDIQQRWTNPLMGWSSSADPVQALKIKFNSKEEAIRFAERQGYSYWIEGMRLQSII
jgi:hypothetical protein